MLAADFEFDLPAELIAQAPAPRGTSRLMVLPREGGAPQHSVVARLPDHLRAGDLLVVNNTRVFAARLMGRRVPSGGAVECLLLTRVQEETRPGEPPSELWDALVHPGQKLRPGAQVRFEGEAGALTGEIVERRYYGRRRVRLRAEGGGSIEALVDALGHVPLPPYIHRPDSPHDRERYQTIYAAVRGSVAAPTAGLHFSPAILEGLDRAGIQRTEITLHVGYGTFKPVRSETVEDHEVDPERYEIPAATAAAIASAMADRRRIVAVGTTTTRALEDAAARGAGRVAAGPGEARLFIYPGFRFRVVDALLTNFHLPRSSLLMLVAAFAGRERVLAAYREAVERRYQFYSYGDAMLIT